MFSYMPRKMKNLADTIFAHRGLHVQFPENTIPAFKAAINNGLSIECDIRFLKDDTIVVYHDRYTKRLTGVPGKISKKAYAQIASYKVENEKIPTLLEILDVVNGKVILLIEVKGRIKQAQVKILQEQLSKKYDGPFYIHTKNIISFHILKKTWNDKVLWILNPFRRRLKFLKGRHYFKGGGLKQYIPTLDELIYELESSDSISTIVSKIYKAFNNNVSRVGENHFLRTKSIAHRGQCKKGLVEHSEEALKECIKAGIVPEIDVTSYHGRLILYHNDSPSSMIGQSKGIGEKNDIENALTLEYALFKLIKGQIELVIDLKVLKLSCLKDVLKILEKYTKIYGSEKIAIQSYNPVHLRYINKTYPEYIIGIVGHSLCGLGKFQKPIRTIVNFLLFHNINKDYVAYNLDSYVYFLVKFSNIIGFPVLGYAPKTRNEALPYKGVFANYIAEGEFFDDTMA